MGLPENLVRDVDHAPPVFAIREMLFPVWAKKLFVGPVKFGSRPSLGMNAVRDARDRDFGNGNTGPNIFPQAAANFSVQFADSISVPTGAQGQDRHTERIVGISRGLAQAEKFIETDSKVARIVPEIPADHFAGKRVVSGGNRGVGGKDIR